MGKKQKKKSFFDQVTGMFETNKAKADNPNKINSASDERKRAAKFRKSGKKSLADRINFGGKGK